MTCLTFLEVAVLAQVTSSRPRVLPRSAAGLGGRPLLLALCGFQSELLKTSVQPVEVSVYRSGKFLDVSKS